MTHISSENSFDGLNRFRNFPSTEDTETKFSDTLSFIFASMKETSSVIQKLGHEIEMNKLDDKPLSENRNKRKNENWKTN